MKIWASIAMLVLALCILSGCRAPAPSFDPNDPALFSPLPGTKESGLKVMGETLAKARGSVGSVERQSVAAGRSAGTNAFILPTPYEPSWSNSWWQIQASNDLAQWTVLVRNYFGALVEGVYLDVTNNGGAQFFRGKMQAGPE